MGAPTDAEMAQIRDRMLKIEEDDPDNFNK